MKIELATTRDNTNGAKAKRIVDFIGAGGFGVSTALKVQARLLDQPAVAFRFIDTEKVDGISSPAFTELRPDRLADDPDPGLHSLIKDHGVPLARYRAWKVQTGKAGVAKLPFLASLAALARVPELAAAIEGDLRARAAAVGGVSEALVITCASTLGGTGAASARVAGLASRLIEGLAPEQRWLHVCITSRLLPAHLCTRRARALEHRQLVELVALTRPGASLRLPGRHAPIQRPGPDLVILLDSSAECPRTVDEAIDELAAVVLNLVTV